MQRGVSSVQEGVVLTLELNEDPPRWQTMKASSGTCCKQITMVRDTNDGSGFGIRDLDVGCVL